MEVIQFLKSVILIGAVIMLQIPISSIRADDLDSDNGLIISRDDSLQVPVPAISDDSEDVLGGFSSEEVVGREVWMSSSAASMLSSISRRPRNTGTEDDCIYLENGFCASDGRIYNDTCSVYARNLLFSVEPEFCQVCRSQVGPCLKKTPLCAGTLKTSFKIYENECELNHTRCELAKARTDLTVREIVTRQYPVESIGNCQYEVESNQLTCYEILRGRCPNGTMKHRVCNTTEPSRDSKTGQMKPGKSYKNICRVLHKRCKKDDDSICYDFPDRCDKIKPMSIIKPYDCSRYIWDLDVGSSQRTCYKYRANSRCDCLSLPPLMPEFLRGIEGVYFWTT